MKVIFFGTSEFAIPVLKKLTETLVYKIIAVITRPDKPVGRKQVLTSSPVKKFILSELPRFEREKILEPEDIKDKIWTKKIQELKPDIIVLAAYGQIIPKSILEIPPRGGLNIHPSLLPKYRGASPIQYAILNGEAETGTTVMLMDEGTDHGPILAKEKLKIKEKETASELTERLANLSAKLFIKTLTAYLAGKIKPMPQEHSEATFTHILRREDGLVNWNKSAKEIERMVRAFTPWPGTYARIQYKTNLRIYPPAPNMLSEHVGRGVNAANAQTKQIKIIKAGVSKEAPADIKPGQFFRTAEGKLAVKCKEGTLILERVQLEGKREMSGEEFLRGHSEISDF